MPSTRSALARKIVGAAAASALLLALAGCGDDDNAGDSAGGDSTSADFCGTAKGLDQEFADADLTDAETLAEVSSMLAAIEPPAEIADDWNAMVSAYEAIVEVDMNDPEAVAALQADPQFANIDESIQNVETYLEEECGTTSE